MVERVEVPVEEGLTGTPQKADNAQTVEEAGIGRPEWLPPEFKSVEAFLESHKELRADHTRKAQELSELKKSVTNGGEEKTEEKAPGEESDNLQIKNEEKAEKGEQVLPGVTNDYLRELSDYAWENESLSDEHYAKLAEAGYSKQMVDQFMAGQFAQVNASTQAIVNAGGGAEQVQRMFDWAASSLDKATVDNYNAKFAAGGPDALMAMENLKTRFEASGDAPGGRMVSGANAPSQATSVYRSVAQVQADMSDPRYKTDPAFRAEVAAKLGRSNVL